MSALPAEIPIFSRQSINAMGPVAKEIAAMLLDAGYIKIVEPGHTTTSGKVL